MLPLQWRIQDFEKGGSSVHVTDRRGVWHVGGHVPPGKFLISDLLRSLLVPFWGETARFGRPTANLVIVFETFNARTKRGSASLRGAGRNFQQATARIRSVVALWI